MLIFVQETVNLLKENIKVIYKKKIERDEKLL